MPIFRKEKPHLVLNIVCHYWDYFYKNLCPLTVLRRQNNSSVIQYLLNPAVYGTFLYNYTVAGIVAGNIT